MEENGYLDINCLDYLGRSGLHLAIIYEHYDVIEYLLDRCKLEIIEDALLHAISVESVRTCEIFLKHSVYTNRRSRFKLQFQHEFYDQEDNASSFSSDITPLILAAHCNNFDIVYMLVQKGFVIHAPHDYNCLCTECSNHKEYDPVVHSRARLNRFRALASTAYMSLSSSDPIVTAFKLSKQLELLAGSEKQYKVSTLNYIEVKDEKNKTNNRNMLSCPITKEKCSLQMNISLPNKTRSRWLIVTSDHDFDVAEIV